MTEKRPWTTDQDRILKYVFESSGLTKWSHIARKLLQDYGIKGRNGKQCKERYIMHIDTSHPKGQWSYEDEQRMFQLHNQLGNKWAIIGSKLGGRDNCVKNHFYSKLRKSLRKMNKVIHQELRKQIKQIKPSALYHIVEVTEQNFKLFPSFDKEFSVFSNQFKNQLLEFSYDDQIQQSNQETNINVEMAKMLIEKMTQFALNYKKKAKKQRRNSAQGPDLLTPNRYTPLKKNGLQNYESEGTTSFVNSSEISNGSDVSDDEVNRSNNGSKSRKNSEDCSYDDMPVIRSRTRSHGNLIKNSNFSMEDNYELKLYKPEEAMALKHDQPHQPDVKLQEENPLEGVLNGMNILQEDHHLPPLLMNKQASRYSRISENGMEPDQYHYSTNFYSQIEMRILPQFGLRRESHVFENLFN